MTITTAERRRLDEEGFVVLDGFVHPELLATLRTRIEQLFEEEGAQAGSEFKQEAGSRRLANLVNKGDIFSEVICKPRLLPYIHHVLGDEIKLSSLNARSANPHNNMTQPLHADMGAISDQKGYWVCNSVWMLDDFTPENGAIRVVPGSHRLGRLPQDVLDDPTSTHPDEMLLTGQAGTVVVMNAHMWHGGLPNQTMNPRTAMHAFYARRDKPQQQYQKQLLSRELQDSLTPKLRSILALDDPFNDEISVKLTVRSGFLK